MNYLNGTLMARKEPVGDAYDEIKVIGYSALKSGIFNAEWNGAPGHAITVQPIEFGETVDMPQAKLEAEYTVTFEPELVQSSALDKKGRVIRPNEPTAEEIFAAEAKKTRGRAPAAAA